MSEPQSRSDDLHVICPYCGYKYQAEAGDYNEHEREQTCGQCDREYLLYDELSVTHYTRPLPEQTGERDL